MPVVERNHRHYSQFRRSLRSLSPFIGGYHFSGIVIALFSCVWLLSCSSASTSSASASQPQGAPNLVQSSLKSLHWCNQPMMIFRDEGAAALSTPGVVTPGTTPTAISTPGTILDWSQVRQNLGFSVFLPASLAAGSCLMSVYGTVHDPIFGSSFTIAYLLPDHTSLSLSEAPVHTGHTNFQCSVSSAGLQGLSATPGPTKSALAMQLCSGMRNTTNIVFSAQWSLAALQKFFQNLQADVDWQPAD